MPYTFSTDDVKSSQRFATPELACDAAFDWLKVSAQNKSFPAVRIVFVPDNVNLVKTFHVERGCCDGTDPNGCYKRQKAEAADARIRERVEARQRAAIGKDEYYGTNAHDFKSLNIDRCPSCRGMTLKSLRMGDKCALCNYIA